MVFNGFVCVARVLIVWSKKRDWKRVKTEFFVSKWFFLTYRFLVFCSLLNPYFYKKGWPQFGSYLKTICRSTYPKFLLSCRLIRYQGWPTQIPRSIVRRTKVAFWSPILAPSGLILNGLGGREWKFVYRFFDLPQQCCEKVFRYRWVFTVMYVDHSYWRVQTFEGIWVLPRLC